jgi:hypothetical protein
MAISYDVISTLHTAGVAARGEPPLCARVVAKRKNGIEKNVIASASFYTGNRNPPGRGGMSEVR